MIEHRELFVDSVCYCCRIVSVGWDMKLLRPLSSDGHNRKIRREGYSLYRRQKEKEVPCCPAPVKPPAIYPVVMSPFLLSKRTRLQQQVKG